jgi:hypothetical protein
MRKLITGFAAAVILALSALALTPQTAAAQGFSITFGTGQPPMVRHYDERRHYFPPPRYDRRQHDRRSYRHAPRHRYVERCSTRIESFWNGYRWVSEPRRICG